MTFPRVGQWVRWSTDQAVKDGKVVRSAYPSLVVHFVGDVEPVVFPWACSFMPRLSGAGSRLELIDKPQGAVRIMSRVSRGLIGVPEAAAALGTTPKQVRSLLRQGKLKGERRDGRWVAVALDPGKP